MKVLERFRLFANYLDFKGVHPYMYFFNSNSFFKITINIFEIYKRLTQNFRAFIKRWRHHFCWTLENGFWNSNPDQDTSVSNTRTLELLSLVQNSFKTKNLATWLAKNIFTERRKKKLSRSKWFILLRALQTMRTIERILKSESLSYNTFTAKKLFIISRAMFIFKSFFLEI